MMTSQAIAGPPLVPHVRIASPIVITAGAVSPDGGLYQATPGLRARVRGGWGGTQLLASCAPVPVKPQLTWHQWRGP